MRVVLLVLGVLAVAGLFVGHSGPRRSASVSAVGHRWLTVAGRRECWPAAESDAVRDRGLQGVTGPARMAFLWSRPGDRAFWMADTPRPLLGVWVSPASRVAGYWRGVPDSRRVIHPRRVVLAVLELPAGSRLPAVGSRVLIGGPCGGRR